MRDVTLVPHLYVNQWRRVVFTSQEDLTYFIFEILMFVFVVDKNNKPMMPTKPSRARRWIKEGKATPFWKRGFFCIRLNFDPSGYETDLVAVGIDPGSKKEGFTVKSQAHTYLNPYRCSDLG